MTAQNILINEWWFVAVVAGVFAYLGVRRGMTVGQFMLISVVVGILLADRLAKFLEPWINISYQIALAVVRERATSPDALVKTMFSQPLLITQDWQRLDLGSLIFVLLVLVGYLIGRRRSVKAKTAALMNRFLAAVVGAVNGYLITFFLLPRYLTASSTVVTVPNVNIKSLLQVQLSLPILLLVLVIITIGVLGTRQRK
jgi:Colicin V production protein